MICPFCGDMIKGHPALSRKDNETRICYPCSLVEAVGPWGRQFAKKLMNNKKLWDKVPK